MRRYEQEENSFIEFRNQVKAWIKLIESQLSEQLESASTSDVDKIIGKPELQSNKDSRGSKHSRRSKSEKSYSTVSSIKEKARLAELMAEKSMLRRKQAIKAAEEELILDTEIAKARAREQVFNEISERKSQSNTGESIQENTTKSRGKLETVTVQTFHESHLQTPPILPQQIPPETHPQQTPPEEQPPEEQPPLQFPPQPYPQMSSAVTTTHVALPSSILSVSSISDSSTSAPRVPTKTQLRSTSVLDRNNIPQTRDPTTRLLRTQQLDPTVPEFHPKKSSVYPHLSPIPPSSVPGAAPAHTFETPSGNSWQDLVSMQLRHNSQIIETNRRLAEAMTLPQPQISTFSGDPLNYQSFITAFKCRIESKTNLADCLYYLNQYLTGEPKELISGCLYADPSEGYIEAKQLLDNEYGDPYKVSTAYINKVINWPTLKFDDATELKRFSFLLKKCNTAMKSLSYRMTLDHPSNLQIVVRKLPFYLQNKWRDRAIQMRKTQRQSATFEDLVNFVTLCAESANDPIFGKAALSDKQSDSKEKEGKRRQNFSKQSSFATDVDASAVPTNVDGAGSSPIIKPCPLCNRRHELENCKLFLKKSIDERKQFLKETRLCFGCFGSEHMVKGCMKKKKCKTCGKLHPTTLHIPGFKLANKNSDKDPSPKDPVKDDIKVNNGSTEVQCNESTVFHTILPVRVRHKGSEKVIETYAFYDNGSDGCFLTETLRNKLELQGVESMLRLGTMHGQSYVNSVVINDLIVTDINDQNPIEIKKLFTREFIPVDHSQIPTSELLNNWQHLNEISNEVPKYKPELEIGLLIGSNCPAALEPQQVLPSVGNGPFAVCLRHGWTISGPLHVNGQNDSNVIVANRITIREVERVKEILTPKSLLNTLEMDFNEHALSHHSLGDAYSHEDKLFIKKVEEKVRFVNGHYEIPLPFRKEKINLPNNQQQAIKRANWQKKKMQRDEKYYRDYVKFVEDIILKGYAEKVPKNNHSTAEPGKIWYIPHHGLYHPKKPDKIRVVFDCSARFQGTSLNDLLLQGPNLTNTLFGVLTRFRQGKHAFMADIEAMFYQVKVPAAQRTFLRFLWWPNGDLHQPMEEYQMTVHIFSAVSSPSCSNFALKKTAIDNQNQFGPEVARTIQRNFYVDDCLKSIDSQQSASDLIVDLRKACTNGGFHLTKFTSNSRSVLETIPEEERSKEVRNLDLSHDNLPIQRALGVQWCVESDLFKFHITLSTKPLTRRGILSVISSVYDPFGFVAPFVLLAKKILQDLCREVTLGWDDEIPSEYHSRWANWLLELPKIENLKINRSLKPSWFGQVISQQIHLFSDASSFGYGVVAYMRLKDENGQVHCSFLIGKSRLAPIKIITIPRLELAAATLSARLGKMLSEELDEKPELVKHHTDSTTVLRYISSDQRRFHVFVANRVQAIKECSDPGQWRYVETRDNPADEASRGMNAETLLNQSRWLNGPSFLWETEDSWPEQPFVLNPVSSKDPEVKRCVNASAVSINSSITTVNKLLEFYSNWGRLKKAVAVFLRLRTMLIKRSQQRKEIQDQLTHNAKKTEFNQPITVQELEEAEIAIIRCVQAQAFNKEIRVLKDAKISTDLDKRQCERRKKIEIKRTSSIYRLSPFLQQDVLRVGGRLRRANIAEETKHPYILPRKNHVTTLLIRYIHQKLGHAGRGHVLATLREKYWIVCANAAVRHELYQCVTCRRMRAPPNVQRMADLPAERLNIAPPFTYVGIDYFGPFFIKDRRKFLKRYGALFTCMASRAIHIEVASSLDTDSFILALRRFIARRGPVRQIRSDNGTNFVGANKELTKSLNDMDQALIQRKLRQIGIDWIFNPPASSHMGGVWERQIRTIRKTLNGILQEHGDRLDDESFRTMICEVEAIVNSRPLTFVSTDPDDLQPLSPNNLLTMKNNIILPPPGNFQREDVYMRRRWRRVQYLANLFWSRWKRQYLVTLQSRQKWNQPKRNVAIGDIVIIQEDDVPRGSWSMGRITATEPDSEGFVRSVKVKTSTTELRRPIHKLVVLLKAEEENTTDKLL